MAVDSDNLWPHWREEWVAYRDERLLVIDKPAGVACHPSEALEISDVGARLGRWLGGRPALLHALDREASGLLVLARDKQASVELAHQLETGVGRKDIVAVTALPRGTKLEPIARRGTRMLLSVERGPAQLRKELARAGAPIAGDRDNRGAPAARLLWHVAELSLRHPTSKKLLRLTSPPPQQFDQWLEDQGFPDTSEIAGCVRAAVMARYALARRDDTDAFRLVHGRADGLHGVQIDRYGDFAAVSLASDEAVAEREAILDAVFALGFRGVYLKLRSKQASTLVDTRRADIAPAAPLRGEAAPEPLWVRELGVEYAVRLGDGLSTGLFLDQRPGRRWLAEAAYGKSVANLFAYHGAFTVAALAGGAARSLTVDASAIALERARENLAGTELEAIGSRHQLLKADVREWLTREREQFDLVVLDPPSFSTTKQHTFRAERDYRAIASLAIARVAPGGKLLACTNLRRMTKEAFRRELHAAAREARREVVRIRSMPLPLDHPPPPGEPCHLKSELIELG